MVQLSVTTFRQELKVLAIVLLFLSGLEIYTRQISPNLDANRAHIHEIPQLVEQSHYGVILGNSLLLHGLQKVPEGFIKVTPTSTAILDWEHLYQRDLKVGKPKHLVLGFVGHHVDDSEPVKLRRLARHFSSSKSLPPFWENEDLSFHQRTQSLLAHHTALVGDQPAHRERILDYFIDWYRLGLQQNQDFVNGPFLIGSSHGKSSFDRFERFLEILKKDQVTLWLIPMPQPEFWELDPKLLELIEEHKINLLDARSLPKITPEDFSDGYHLGETGGKKFTDWLLPQLP